MLEQSVDTDEDGFVFLNTVCRTFYRFILMKIKLHGNIGVDTARISVQFVVAQEGEK